MASNDDVLDMFSISTIDLDAIMAQDAWKTNRPGVREALLKQACGLPPLNDAEDWLYGQGFPTWFGFTLARQETRREFRTLSKEFSAKAHERHVYYCFADGTTRHFHGGEEVTTMAEDGCDEETNQRKVCSLPPLNDEEEWIHDQGVPTWFGFILARQETRREFRVLSKEISAKVYERHVFYCFDDGTTRHFHGGEEVTMDPTEVN